MMAIEVGGKMKVKQCTWREGGKEEARYTARHHA